MSDMTKLKEALDLLSRQNVTNREYFQETNDLLKSIKNSLIYANVLILILLILVLFKSP